jgi:nifR3 family TIM-barrel protein
MLRLGPIALDLPAVQAALSGYSDLAMRRVARVHGAPFAFHEVVLDRLVLTRGKGRKRVLHVPDDDHPVGGQLMGSEPEAFGAAAADLVAAGSDLVDINFGCPVSKVLGRCRGGYLLSQPADALEIVARVLDAVAGRVPVTLKMRRGLDDSPASRERFFAILDGAFARGVASVTVHGRTVRQKYVGPSSWEFLAEVKRHVGARTLLGSGDLFSPFAIRRMLAETGVDGVTVARGCIGNPWIFAQTRALLAGRVPRAPTLAEQRAAIEQHAAAAGAIYDPITAAAKTRHHAIKYAQLHPEPVAVRDAFVAVRDARALRAVLEEWYDEARFGRGGGALEAGDEAVDGGRQAAGR